MKNFIAPGNVVTLIAPTGGVVSGQVVVVGQVRGVAAYDAPAGAEVEVSVEGVFDLNKTPADTLAAGSVARVDATGTVAAAGTTAIGWVVSAAGAGVTLARVRLTPGIAPTATMEEAKAPPPEAEPQRVPHRR